MRRLFTIFTFILLTSGAVFSQTCSDEILLLSSNTRLLMVYGTVGEAEAVINNTTSVDITQGGVTENFLLNPVIATNSGKFRVRLASNSTFSNPFTGTIVLNLTGGATLTCTYEAGVLTSSVLPVELISFRGQQTERQIDLSWTTASEVNNEGFEVERGQKFNQEIRWESIGFIEGKGNTSDIQEYGFLDKTPTKGINYYRLKQMDFDGHYEYSTVVAVEYAKTDRGVVVEIFPNPAREQLTVVNGDGIAIIYNLMGQVVKQLKVNSDLATISLSELHNGQYILQVLKEDGTVATEKFAKID